MSASAGQDASMSAAVTEVSREEWLRVRLRCQSLMGARPTPEFFIDQWERHQNRWRISSYTRVVTTLAALEEKLAARAAAPRGPLVPANPGRGSDTTSAERQSKRRMQYNHMRDALTAVVASASHEEAVRLARSGLEGIEAGRGTLTA